MYVLFVERIEEKIDFCLKRCKNFVKMKKILILHYLFSLVLDAAAAAALLLLLFALFLFVQFHVRHWDCLAFV
jgi:hypothetical protein